MTEWIILVGGGGHCKACIAVIEAASLPIAGIIDMAGKGSLLDYPVLGNDDSIESFRERNSFLVTVGQIKSAAIRVQLYEKLVSLGATIQTVIAPSAIVSRHAAVGKGTIVMHQAIVNSSAVIGVNCIINNNALVEHDATVGAHTHISTGSVLNGECRIGDRCFIGSQSVISHGVALANDVVIGAGSVVIKNITEAGTYAGNPAKRIG